MDNPHLCSECLEDFDEKDVVSVDLPGMPGVKVFRCRACVEGET